MPDGMWVDAFDSHIALFYLCLSAVLAGDVADAEASDGSAVGVKEHWLCAWFFGSALMQVTFEHSTDDEITFILEYYHNDGGISRDSAKNFLPTTKLPSSLNTTTTTEESAGTALKTFTVMLTRRTIRLLPPAIVPNSPGHLNYPRAP